ncbi:uberolysin/carnocyclin family circular bacteriocin [Streptomyces sp. NPDC002589]|uniref:uberolysin/carnocyclin family circular bacteriocin n=1 Tax=unclassified Streptomyces TaxID=2593676 RepID=UPI00332295A0
MSAVATSKKRLAAAGAAVAGLAAPFTLALSVPDALGSYFGLSTVTANRVFDAIEAGTDVATALSVLGGVTAAGGLGLWMLKKAIANGGKKVVIA